MDVAKAFGRRDIIRLLETHEQNNEFVCATFASDVTRMMEVLALGEGNVPLFPVHNNSALLLRGRYGRRHKGFRGRSTYYNFYTGFLTSITLGTTK